MNPKKDIKYIPIKDYLQQKGIYPTKIYSGYGLYKNAFRDEETASFKVDYNKTWHYFEWRRRKHH